jgi:hypothetical protein
MACRSGMENQALRQIAAFLSMEKHLKNKSLCAHDSPVTAWVGRKPCIHAAVEFSGRARPAFARD